MLIKGVYTWNDKRQFIGDWKFNKMDGKGVFTWPDNRRYEGDYKDDKKEGYGEFYWYDLVFNCVGVMEEFIKVCGKEVNNMVKVCSFSRKRMLGRREFGMMEKELNGSIKINLVLI